MTEKRRSYFNSLSQEKRRYFDILAPNFPKSLEKWLDDYIATPEVQHAKDISMFCGCQFLNFWNLKVNYNILDHSVACALIIWHFTKDKKQMLAGLFHDISNPAFKHCVDIMNGDALTQESIEAPTESLIRHSAEIMNLLKRDKIKVGEVCDYHIYPIADNDTPRLATDRLEYTFGNAHLAPDYKIKMPLSRIKRFYSDLIIGQNEDGLPEIAFEDYKIADEYINIIKDLWHNWLDNRYQLSGEAYATLLKRAVAAGDFTAEDLYHIGDKEALSKLKRSKDESVRTGVRNFLSAKTIHTGDKPPKGNKFVVKKYPIKVRYIDPLVCTEITTNPKTGETERKFTRLSKVSKNAKMAVQQIKHFPVAKYAWFDFTL